MAKPDDSPIGRLIELHFASRLLSYNGNLAFARNVVDNGWLADESDPEIQQHIATLRQHLAEGGQPEKDVFLLRVGLAAPGKQRGIVPPVMVLIENRGGFSKRRQKEAEGQVRRLREALDLGRQFLPELNPQSQAALFELADWIKYRKQPTDEQLLDGFRELNGDEARQLAEQAMRLHCLEQKVVRKIGRDILQRLACFRNNGLSDENLAALILRREFWPASLYRDGSEAIAAQLVAILSAMTDKLQRDHLLQALAWTRSDLAYISFRRWTKELPDWANDLSVPIADYVHCAGWCIDDDGEGRELISSSCRRLKFTESASSQSVPCRVKTDQPCPTCGAPGRWLFDFSSIASDYFTGEWADAPRKILTCLSCANWGPIFTSYSADGTSDWLSLPESKRVGDPSVEKKVLRQIEDRPCSPFVCSEAFSLNDASTLGGIPMWLQDSEYPRCIECSRRMTFLAQHDNGPCGDEGIYHAFFCARCHVATTTYEQT